MGLDFSKVAHTHLHANNFFQVDFLHLSNLPVS